MQNHVTSMLPCIEKGMRDKYGFIYMYIKYIQKNMQENDDIYCLLGKGWVAKKQGCRQMQMQVLEALKLIQFGKGQLFFF